MDNLVPNLGELVELLEKNSDAAELAAAFAVGSIPEAQENLKKVVTSWERPTSDPACSAGQVSS